MTERKPVLLLSQVKCKHGTPTEFYHPLYKKWEPWWCSKCLNREFDNAKGGKMGEPTVVEMTVTGMHLMRKEEDWEIDRFVVEAREEDKIGGSMTFICEVADLVPGTKIRVLIESAE